MNRELGCRFGEEEVPGGWKRVTGASNALITAIVGSYWRHIPDGSGVGGFLASFGASELFISHDGWLMIAEAKPGVSAVVHAGKWGLHSDEDGSHYEELLNWICQMGKFGVLNARMADHADMTIRLAKDIGFEETGIIPAFDTYMGETHNLILFSRIIK